MTWTDISRKVVVGAFNDPHDVHKLIDKLEDRGLYDNDVSLVMSEATRMHYPHIYEASKAPEGATTGGLTGGLLGALLGGLTMVGSVIIPGAELLIAGPIVGMLAGGAVGASAGTLVGALVGSGIPEHEAKLLEDEVKNKGTIFVVAHVNIADVEEVRDLFQHYGARDTSVMLEDAATHNF